MAKMDSKSWREQTIENVGVGEKKTIYFSDTKPNYILLTNPCHSPLYVSTSPSVSDKVADIIIPINGRQLFSQMHGVKELHIICYDGDLHSVRVKSWEGEFDPVTLNQTQEITANDPDQHLGNVVVTNFPSTQKVTVQNPSIPVAVNNFPATQPVSGSVGVTGTVGISNFPATQPVSGSVGVSNFPASQAVRNTTLEASVTATNTKLDTLNTNLLANNAKADATNLKLDSLLTNTAATNTKLDSLIALMTDNNLKLDTLIAKP